MFGIFQIVDKDPIKKDQALPPVIQSEEILIERQERDKYQSDIEALKQQIEDEKKKKESAQ
jgi:hypothetical protein